MTAPKLHPRAKAGCKGCEGSVSGVCPKHSTVDVENHPRRCVGINEDGGRCRKWGTKESDPPRCATHDENYERAEQAKVRPGRGNANAKKAQKAATAALEMLGREGDTIDSLEELEALAAEALGFKDYLRSIFQQSVIGGRDTEDADLARYVTAMDRCGRLLETFAKQGLAERELKMREELVGIVTGLFNTVLASFIPVENQAEAQLALGSAVAALEPQRALTVGSSS